MYIFMYVCVHMFASSLGVCYDPITEQSASHQPKSWYRTLNYSFEDNATRILSVPIYRTPDEVGDINVSNLVRIFGMSAPLLLHFHLSIYLSIYLSI